MELLNFWSSSKTNFTLKANKGRTDFIILSRKFAGEADEIQQSRNPWQSQDGQKERKNCQTEDENCAVNCADLRDPHLDKGNFKTELQVKIFLNIANQPESKLSTITPHAEVFQGDLDMLIQQKSFLFW